MNDEISNFSNKDFKIQSKLIKLNLCEDRNNVEKPSAYILGGQPGAGKTNLHNILRKQHDNNIIIINNDEFRKFHPNFNEIQKKYGKDSVEYTQDFSSKITEFVINKLSDEKYNLIIEGTLRTSDVPLNSQKMLVDKGYKTELSIIATKPEMSYLSTILRYEEMYISGEAPRATPMEHHDRVVKAMPNNLSKIYQSNRFDNITIYNRKNECLYNQKINPQINPRDIILETFNRHWTSEEIEKLNNDIGKIISHMKNRNAPELKNFKNYVNNLIRNIAPIEPKRYELVEKNSIKDKIIDTYSKELPSIKHISEKTATIIDNLNNTKGHVHTIKEIKELHNEAGKKLENSNRKEDLEEFKDLNEVVDDLKQAKLISKQEQAHENAMNNQISKSNIIEIGD